MTLLLLIPVVWLAIVASVVALSKLAAQGDARQAQQIATERYEIAPGLTVWEQPPAEPARERAFTTRSRRIVRQPRAVA